MNRESISFKTQTNKWSAHPLKSGAGTVELLGKLAFKRGKNGQCTDNGQTQVTAALPLLAWRTPCPLSLLSPLGAPTFPTVIPKPTQEAGTVKYVLPGGPSTSRTFLWLGSHPRVSGDFFVGEVKTQRSLGSQAGG